MKLAILLLCLAATCLQPPVLKALPNIDDHGGKIDSKYDGFSHETIFTLKKMKVTCDGTRGNFKDSCVSITTSLHCPGIQLDYVRYARIQLIFQSKDWDQRHPVDQRDLSVVADGVTIRLGRMELAGHSTDVMMTEVLEAIIPYKTFRQIADAQVVEMQVGKSKFELRQNNLLALRDLNNRVMTKK
ncbi:MAG TPA: hypothetical protein VJV03_10680 [Pyrinomonadaceae bacterium]|nr:hypothetical protein [Pyrinomonadaceae bacterium]